VTVLDLVLLGVLALMGLGGFRRGLIVGILSLAGLVAGAYLGARVGPQLVGGDESRWLPLATLLGALVGASLLQSGAVLAGRSLRTLVAIGPLRALDAAGGAVLGIATGLVFCWVLGAVLLYLPGQDELRRQAQRSTILSTLNDEFPPQRLMDALSRVDPFAVLAGPGANVPQPDARILRDPDVVAAGRSVVRVTGFACGLGIEGSGWIAAPGLVVTNAHVVAGVDGPRVDRRDGRFHDSSVVWFDARDDLALLRVSGLAGRALPLADPRRGLAVAVLGFPENGPYRALPARLGGTVTSVGRDAYGRFPVPRTVTTMRGVVRSGNSGGPAVDAAGRVRTTVFARRAGSEGGYGVPTDRVREALSEAGDTPLQTECVER
jgi:S1-C subfamily serine protease